MGLVEAFMEILRRPTIGAIVLEMLMFLGPVWIAFFLGIMVGWAWRPRWASLGNCRFDSSAPSSPSSSIPSPVKRKDSVGSAQSFGSFEARTRFASTSLENHHVDKESLRLPLIEMPNSSSSLDKEEENLVVTEEDLRHLCHLVERKDGGPPWKHMMDCSTANMTYQAWQRDPETGPPQYCSRTIYEDVTPELLRDFFWDDEFRSKWDDMFLHGATLEECLTTGANVVHWIRKFPFFCSDREYIIGRRIWQSGRSFYCVTKGVPCSSIPRKQKPRRVDLYYSSWFIQSVETKKVGSNLPACEVIFFHHEDMGIPWEIAKFGVRQGMWGAARKVERGFRSYQKERASAKTISHHAFMAQINTKIDENYLTSLESDEDSKETQVVIPQEKQMMHTNVPKLVIFGGAVILACSLDRGLLTKAIIFDVARRFANIGKRMNPRT